MTYVFLAAVVLAAFLLWRLRPRLDRDWAPEQARLPKARFEDGVVVIDNVRNFIWRTASDHDARWESRSYRPDDLRSIDYVVVPFGKFRGMAHSFLTFGFSDGRHLAVSVEVRRERKEAYDPLRGLLRQYELMYVVGDERDLIGVRLNVRKNAVYLFPVRASPAQMRALFASVLDRANELLHTPEFYNTLFNNCATNILRHVNELLPEPRPYTLRVAIPGYSAKYAWEHGLVDTELPFPEAVARFRLKAPVGVASDEESDPDGRAWSRRIRGGA